MTKLEAQIRTLENNPDKVFSPVSDSIDLRGMHTSGDPSAQRDAQIITLIQSLQSDVARLEKRLPAVTEPRETPRSMHETALEDDFEMARPRRNATGDRRIRLLSSPTDD